MEPRQNPPNLKLVGSITKSADQKVYHGVASREVYDRQGDIVRMSAFYNIQAWLKSNPVIFYDHAWVMGGQGEDRLPIGKGVGAGVEGDSLMLDWVFSDLEFAQKVKRLVDTGFLNTLSIGFMPREWKDIEGTNGREYLKADLLEVSVVGIPANPEALILHGMKKEDVVAMSGLFEEIKHGTRKDALPVNQTGALSVESGGGLSLFELRTIAKQAGRR